MIEELIKQLAIFLGIKTNTFESLIFILFVALFLLMTKEFRTIYVKELDNNYVRQGEAIQLLSNLLALSNGKMPEVEGIISYAYRLIPYITSKEYKNLLLILQNTDHKVVISEVKIYAQKKLDELMYKQQRSAIIGTKPFTGSFEGFVERIKYILYPTLSTIGFFIFLFILIFIITRSNNGFINAAHGISFVLSLLTLTVLADIFIFNEINIWLKQLWKLLIITVPLILVLFVNSPLVILILFGVAIMGFIKNEVNS
ncbi:MAG: hypothetical protein ACO1OT_18995 [Heyndrickxia sp.]